MVAHLESCLEDLPLWGITLQAGDAVPWAGYGWMWGQREQGVPVSLRGHRLQMSLPPWGWGRKHKAVLCYGCCSHDTNTVLSLLVPSLRLAQSLFALFASSLAISLVFAIIPLCHNVVVLAVVMAVAGLAMGCIDTISNMQLVKIYQKDSAIFLQVSVEPASPLAVLPPLRKKREERSQALKRAVATSSTCVPHLLQALHFFVGFGALLSPLIADPFLSDTNCILSNATANASSNLPHIRKSLVPHHPGNLSHYDLPMKGMVVTRVSYAFWIMALINVSAAGAVGVPQTAVVFGGARWVVPAMEEACGWLCWSAAKGRVC